MIGTVTYSLLNHHLWKLVVVLSMALLAVTVNGQDLAVKSFDLLTNDMSARINAPRYDSDGKLAALIKVVTNLEDLEFEGGTLGLVETQRHTGEYWVYVPDKSRTLTIKHPTCTVLRNEPYSVEIVSGNVYELRLECSRVEGSVSRNLSLPTGTGMVRSEPSGASVFLDGKFYGSTPLELPELIAGPYDVVLTKDEFADLKGVLVLEEGIRIDTLFRLEGFGGLGIRSTPEGANVYLDGKYQGKTPIELEQLESTTYLLELRLAEYITLSEFVKVTPQITQRIDKTLTSLKKSYEPEMVFVEGGRFLMGCDDSQEPCENDEIPPVWVTVGGFEMSKYEITREQWVAVMGSDPSNQPGCGSCPVINVSWADANRFIDRLNANTGKNYRLPTEAEWEFAARGGTKTNKYKYSGGNALYTVAWVAGNSDQKSHIVGRKLPNELGIYDMSGNVWEWCQDWYSPQYSIDDTLNPVGAYTGTHRVLRGGAWNRPDKYCRIADRNAYGPNDRSNSGGFRVVISRK